MTVPSVSSFLSPAPTVQLLNGFSTPFRNVVATARTCYSGKGVINPEELSGDYIGLAQSIFKAGHHTTFQHPTFQFTIANVSRQFIWSFLHSHPFYNSEQVSQRYVTVKSGNYAIPPLSGEALNIYCKMADDQMAAYHQLVTLLTPVTEEAFYQRFPQHSKTPDKWAKAIQKRAQEVARYVLPLATFAYLYHTISALTLLRYWRLSQMFDVPAEQTLVIQQMINALLKCDPDFEKIIEDPIPIEETPEYQFFIQRPQLTSYESRKTFISEFDASLDGLSTKLVDWKGNQETILAQSVREVLGIPKSTLTDEEAIALVLDPSKNHILGETMNLTTLDKLTRCAYHASYTFRKKISHSADSQDQRHRMTPASRPVFCAGVSDEPDYIVPELVDLSPEALTCYQNIMNQTWESVLKLKSLGVSEEFTSYLLPNAIPVRFTESADLLNLRHKHIMRLCYNAQEEIWRSSVEEQQQIVKINPLIGKYLGPPCQQRFLAKVTPFCPEGDRFCGVPVWKLEPSQYQRVI